MHKKRSDKELSSAMIHGKRKQYFGVDFSGASRAGRHIWVASAVLQDRTLIIHDCRRGDELPGSGRARNICLEALLTWIEQQGDAVIGFDFPFSLPVALMPDDSWEQFVLQFPERYGTAEAFRRACLEAAGGAELKRVTEWVNKTPFSPYNLRLYRQTYYGISHILSPLVREKKVSVLPMQRALPGRPQLIEVCPASTLKVEKMYLPYKGRGEEKQAARLAILQYFEQEKNLRIERLDLRERVLDDRGGDALDSILAAFAASRAQATVPGNEEDVLEGQVYM